MFISNFADFLNQGLKRIARYLDLVPEDFQYFTPNEKHHKDNSNDICNATEQATKPLTIINIYRQMLQEINS